MKLLTTAPPLLSAPSLTSSLFSLSLSLSRYHEAQNQWLRQNTVDAHGNLLYCRDCIVACLGVHTSRIQRQR